MSKRVFIYACIGLIVCNLISIFVYRFRLNSTIDQRFSELSRNLSILELNLYNSVTNFCYSSFDKFTNDTFVCLSSSSSPIIAPVSDDKSFAGDLLSTSSPPRTKDYILDYRFFTSGGSPWIELEGEYYTLGDDILGYGCVSNCSRVAILLDTGDRIFNQTKRSYTKPQKQIEVAAND